MTAADIDQLIDEVTDALDVLAKLLARQSSNGMVLLGEHEYLDLVARAHGAKT